MEQKKLCVITQNIRSSVNIQNKHAITALTILYKPDILVITETWHKDQSIIFNGKYDHHWSQNSKHHGVVILTKEEHGYLPLHKKLWTQEVVMIRNHSTTVIGVYID